MKILLRVFKIIIFIPATYYLSVLVIRYFFHESWETSYKMAPMCTVGALFYAGIRYVLKNGG